MEKLPCIPKLERASSAFKSKILYDGVNREALECYYTYVPLHHLPNGEYLMVDIITGEPGYLILIRQRTGEIYKVYPVPPRVFQNIYTFNGIRRRLDDLVENGDYVARVFVSDGILSIHEVVHSDVVPFCQSPSRPVFQTPLATYRLGPNNDDDIYASPLKYEWLDRGDIPISPPYMLSTHDDNYLGGIEYIIGLAGLIDEDYDENPGPILCAVSKGGEIWFLRMNKALMGLLNRFYNGERVVDILGSDRIIGTEWLSNEKRFGDITVTPIDQHPVYKRKFRKYHDLFGSYD